ncbi:MAG: small multi-drug export protein [Candidatus Thermoplasmatota archaeon]|nr:small multi-drug export protein [Candidatus Thermoplasmatota archaeon]
MIKNRISDLLEDPVIRFFISISPAVIAALFCVLLGPEVYLPVGGVFLSFYFALGVGWIASPVIGISSGMNPVILVALLVFISSESSLIVSANYDILEKIPLFGRMMKGIRKKAGKVIKKHDLAENVEYFSIFWLMFLPLYGTGPMVMTLVGRLLNLSWKKVWAVITLSALTRFTLITGLLYLGYISLTF